MRKNIYIYIKMKVDGYMCGYEYVVMDMMMINIGLKLNIHKTKIMASGPITSWKLDGETVTGFIYLFFLAPKSLQMVIAAMKLKDAYSLEGKLWPT